MADKKNVAPVDGLGSADEDVDGERDPHASDLPTDEYIEGLRRSASRQLVPSGGRVRSSFGQYLHEIGRFRLIEPEEEIALARAAREGYADARELLVRHSLRFVVAVARRFQNRGVDIEDLVEDGNRGLLRAIEHFEPKRGVRFVSYAVYYIKEEIYRGLASQQRSVRLPRNRVSELTTIRAARSASIATSGRAPDSYEISERTGVSVEMVEVLLRASRDPLSLDMPKAMKSEEQTLQDRLAEASANSTAEDMEALDRDAALRRALAILGERERTIIEMLYGIGRRRSYTGDEIGAVLGVTRERVRQLHKRALEALRAPEVSEVLADYSASR